MKLNMKKRVVKTQNGTKDESFCTIRAKGTASDLMGRGLKEMCGKKVDLE